MQSGADGPLGVDPGTQPGSGDWSSERSLAAKRESWSRLSALLDRVDQGGLAGLQAEELRELGRLHRRVASHLAQARSGRRDAALVAYLNALVLRSHSTVYRTPSRPAGRALLRFIAHEFPATCQRCSTYVLAAVGLALLFTSVSFWASYCDPAMAAAFVPVGIYSKVDPDSFDRTPELGTSADWVRSAFSSAIMWNNIRVGVLCFAGGILAGVPTLLMLAQNCFMLGGLAGWCHASGVTWRFWALILPHGVVELTAIFVCAAAGFRLGYAVIAPGRYYRRDALALAGRDAVRLALGTVPMFILAGLVEGFFSPTSLPDTVKLSFAAVLGSLTVVYLCFPRHIEEPDDA